MNQIITEFEDKELIDYLSLLKQRIKEFSQFNVAKPLDFKGTKQEYISQLIKNKVQVKKEIKYRKKRSK